MVMTIQDGTYDGIPAFRIVRKFKGTELCPDGRRQNAEISMLEVRLKDEFPISKDGMDGFDMGLEDGGQAFSGDYCDNSVTRTLVQIRGEQKSAGQTKVSMAFRIHGLNLENEEIIEQENQD
jgi:hypothetical protein